MEVGNGRSPAILGDLTTPGVTKEGNLNSFLFPKLIQRIFSPQQTRTDLNPFWLLGTFQLIWGTGVEVPAKNKHEENYSWEELLKSKMGDKGWHALNNSGESGDAPYITIFLPPGVAIASLPSFLTNQITKTWSSRESWTCENFKNCA